MVHYIIFNQTIPVHRFLYKDTHADSGSVRSGNIATELARPWDSSPTESRLTTARKSTALSLEVCLWANVSVFGMRLPKSLATWAWTLLSLGIGAYIGIVSKYIVGVTAFWTTEIRTAWSVETSLIFGFGGTSMPLEVLPALAQRIAVLTPFPCVCYYPARIFLELSGPTLIWRSLFWAAALTFAAQALTAIVRRKLEVQGG